MNGLFRLAATNLLRTVLMGLHNVDEGQSEGDSHHEKRDGGRDVSFESSG